MFRRKSRQDRIIKTFADAGFPEFANKMATVWSDAGQYLSTCAHVDERVRTYADRVESIQQSLRQRGSWEQTWEWRISTVGTEKIEAKQGAYSTSVDHHGVWTASFATLAEALEAVHVLSTVQRNLFRVVGWSSWAGKGQLDPTDPVSSSKQADKEHGFRATYLERLSREAREVEELPVKTISDLLSRGERWSDRFEFAGRDLERFVFTDTYTDWDGSTKTHIRYGVVNRTMRMESNSPTPERAREFMGIFMRLQRDLADVLEWRWR